MTANPPEAAVEAVARALNPGDWEHMNDATRSVERQTATKILSAALPHLTPIAADPLVDRVAEALHAVWGYRGNPEVLIHEDPRGPATVAVRAMGARTAPDRDDILDALNNAGAVCGDCGREPGDPLDDCPDCKRCLGYYADDLLAVLADQPTIAEVRAQALTDAADTVAAARPDPTTGAAPGHYAGLSHAARILRDRANQERSR